MIFVSIDGTYTPFKTEQQVEGCRTRGVPAVLHDRREHVLHYAPIGHRRVRVRWRKRVWRCPGPAGLTVTFTETHPLSAPRAPARSSPA